MREMNLSDDVMTIDNLNLAAGRAGLFGMKVVVSQYLQPVARITIRHDFEWCSDAFRANTNHWLLATFGTKEVCYMVGKDTVVVSPKQAAALKL